MKRIIAILSLLLICVPFLAACGNTMTAEQKTACREAAALVETETDDMDAFFDFSTETQVIDGAVVFVIHVKAKGFDFDSEMASLVNPLCKKVQNILLDEHVYTMLLCYDDDGTCNYSLKDNYLTKDIANKVKEKQY